MKFYTSFKHGETSRAFTQTLRIMKLTFALILIALLQVNASSFGQKITLRENKTSLEKVLKEIRKQSGYDLLYAGATLANTNSVTVDVKDMPLNAALEKCFKNQPVTFSIVNKTILIEPKKDLLEAEMTQLATITGKVVDENGRPLPSVTVLRKGDNKGTITDDKGNFSIQAVKGDMLVFSSIGFKVKEVLVGDGPVNVTLIVEVSALDETIIGANIVATKRKADVTSTTVLSAKDLERIPSNNLVDIFTGIIPGTYSLNYGNSAVNGFTSNTIYIRGASNVFGNNPIKLYVDGVEIAGGSTFLGTIDKNSVEKIEIVRGANATALYGSDAGGGVILITTKKGKSNETSINAMAAVGTTSNKWVPGTHPKNEEGNFSISQGIDNVTYNIGGTYRRADAVLYPGSYANTGSVHGSTAITLSKQLNITISGNYSNSISGDIPTYQNGKYEKPDSLRRNTTTFDIGTVIAYKPVTWWAHNITAGFSENQRTYVSDFTFMPKPQIVQYGTYVSRKPNLRYNNTLNFGKTEDVAITITTGLEASRYTGFDNLGSGGVGQNPSTGQNQANTIYYSNIPELTYFGYFGQAQISLFDKYFITISDRQEKSNTFNNYNSAPKIGATTNFNVDNFILKPRISYGTGITNPPYEALHPEFSYPITLGGYVWSIPNPAIKPQEQKGVDVGFEIYTKKNDFKMEVSYYNNKLNNTPYYNFALNPLYNPATPPSLTNIAAFLYTFEVINISKVANKGIELSSTYNKDGFRITANYSRTLSILNVDLPELSLKKGDQLPFVPLNIFGANAGYDFKKLFGDADVFSVALGMTGVNKGQYVSGQSFNPQTGTPITLYTPIPTVIRFTLNFNYYATKTVSFGLSGANIFNNYKSEYALPVVGSSFLFSIKYHIIK